MVTREEGSQMDAAFVILKFIQFVCISHWKILFFNARLDKCLQIECSNTSSEIPQQDRLCYIVSEESHVTKQKADIKDALTRCSTQ